MGPTSWLDWGRISSKLSHMSTGRICSSWIVSPSASDPHWLVGIPLSFLAHGPHSTSQHGSWLPQSEQFEAEREQVCARWKSQSFIAIFQKWHPHHICHTLLKTRHLVHPTQKRRGLYKSVHTGNWGSLGANLEATYHIHTQELVKIESVKIRYMIIKSHISIEGVRGSDSISYWGVPKSSVMVLCLSIFFFCRRAVNFCFIYFEDK